MKDLSPCLLSIEESQEKRSLDPAQVALSERQRHAIESEIERKVRAEVAADLQRKIGELNAREAYLNHNIEQMNRNQVSQSSFGVDHNQQLFDSVKYQRLLGDYNSLLFKFN